MYAKSVRWVKRKRNKALTKTVDSQVVPFIANENEQTVILPTNCLLLVNFGLIDGISYPQITDLIKVPSANILLPFNRNYSIVTFENEEQASGVFLRLTDQNCKNDEIYPFFLTSVPNFDLFSTEIDPSEGLILHDNFFSKEEEVALIHFVDNLHVSNSSMKIWQLYDLQSWPAKFLLDTLDEQKLLIKEPNQLTIYELNPAGDRYPLFGDEIILIALLSPIVIQPKAENKMQTNVLLEPRSALVLLNEPSQKWQLADSSQIVVEKSDGSLLKQFQLPERNALCVPSEGFRFGILRRQRTVIFAFRKMNESEHLKSADLPGIQTLEQKYVREVYNAVAPEFSSTRHTPWPKVAEFVRSLPEGSLMADAGCGNGRYFAVNANIFTVGSDFSENLLKLAAQVTPKCGVVVANCCQLPFRSDSMDAVISIAVIHHLASEERRKMAVDEMVRILRPKGGRALIHVWAVEQNDRTTGEASTYTAHQRKVCEQKTVTVNGVVLPVHQPRTPFNASQPDCFVPWKKDSLRYYHVFKQGELEELYSHLEGKITITNHYFDEGNWCIEFVKK